MEIKVPREVGLRLARADEQLVLLQDEVKAYLETIPYTTRIEAEPGRADRRRLVVGTKSIPLTIQVRLSDCVHHGRASLDNFAYAVSRRHSGHTPRSEFPIFLDPVRFGKEGFRKVQGMKAGAREAIEQLQPYNGGGVRDPLWMLHELSNADKHRLMHTVGGVLESGSYRIDAVDPGVVVIDVRFLRKPVCDGSLIGYVYVDKRGDPSGTFRLTFSLTYNLVFERRTNDSGQALPTNGRRVNITTGLIRDSVWHVFSTLQRFAGRSDVVTIQSAPLMHQ